MPEDDGAGQREDAEGEHDDGSESEPAEQRRFVIDRHAAGGLHVAVPDIAGDVDVAADVAAAEQHEQLEVPAFVQRDAGQMDHVVVVSYAFVAVD